LEYLAILCVVPLDELPPLGGHCVSDVCIIIIII